MLSAASFPFSGLTGLRVVDHEAAGGLRGAYPGPQFGLAGSRKLTGVYGRPIIGTIVKPALGLRPQETAELVGELIQSGVDFIKDDEKLMSPVYSPLKERVAAIMPKILDHEQKTGKKVMYAFGISHADPDEMMRNHDLVLKAGGNCAVVNINSIGMGGMAFLRKRSGLVLHAHRNGWDVLTRHPGIGFDFKVWQQFWRLLGVDQFQINGIGVKYWEPDESFVESFKAVSYATVRRVRLRASRCRLRSMGRASARNLPPHRPHDRSSLSVRRRHRQSSRWPRRRCACRAAGLASSGCGHPARNLCRGPSGVGGVAQEIRQRRVRAMTKTRSAPVLLWRRPHRLHRCDGSARLQRRGDRPVHGHPG